MTTDLRTVLAYESGQERLRGLLSGLISRSDAVAAIEAEMDKANQYVAAGCGGEVGIDKNIARAIFAAINALPAINLTA